MKKKTYLQPCIEVAKVKKTNTICTSQFPSIQNEKYKEAEESETEDWYN